MTAIAHVPGNCTAAAEARPVAFTAEAFDDLAAVEELWRELETTGTASPYQRFDWVKAYIGATAAVGGLETRILVIRTGAGCPCLLLPLMIERRHGLRIAAPVGGKHANFHLPLTANTTALPSPAMFKLLLADAGRRLGIDLFLFSNLPLSWRGVANPLAGEGRPSPSNGYRLKLDADGEATLARALSKDTRKKLRQKDKRLRALGAVAYRVAAAAEEVDAILAAFHEQKRARFREMGISNPFEAPAIQAFLHAACIAGLEDGRPGIELHALMLGERIIAVFGAAVDAERCCGMFNSFEADPAVARASPGELLMLEVIRRECRQGRRIFDLGVGEARYKDSLCDEVEPLVDSTVPVSLRGRCYAVGATAFRATKRVVKRTPWSARLLGKVRKALRR